MRWKLNLISLDLSQVDMSTPRKLSLEAFVRRFSSCKQSEHDIVVAAVKHLDPHSSAHQVATQCLAKWSELEEYLESAGFEL